MAAETKIALFEFEGTADWHKKPLRDAVNRLGWEVVGSENCPELAVVMGIARPTKEPFLKFLDESLDTLYRYPDVYIGLAMDPSGNDEQRGFFKAVHGRHHIGDFLENVFGFDREEWGKVLSQMLSNRQTELNNEGHYSRAMRLSFFKNE